MRLQRGESSSGAVGEDGFHSRSVESGDRRKMGSRRRRGRRVERRVCMREVRSVLSVEVEKEGGWRGGSGPKKDGFLRLDGMSEIHKARHWLKWRGQI